MRKKITFIPPKRFDAVTELLKRMAHTDKSVPVLSKEEVYRDKPTTAAFH